MLAARFVNHPDGTPDGSVHSLYVISGRTDAGSCAIAQPDFATALAQNNVIFRISVPLFGAGLVEAITDGAILANKGANAAAQSNWAMERFAETAKCPQTPAAAKPAR